MQLKKKGVGGEGQQTFNRFLNEAIATTKRKKLHFYSFPSQAEIDGSS